MEIAEAQGKLNFAIDGRKLDADGLEVAPGIYSILIAGECFEARVERQGALLCVTVEGQEYSAEIIDSRRLRRGRGGGMEAEGRQQVRAPMPGKVIRVLANAGNTIEANKGIVVIEAMKMQNEVRSPKSGTVEQILVTEGQAVNSGDVLAVIA